MILLVALLWLAALAALFSGAWGWALVLGALSLAIGIIIENA